MIANPKAIQVIVLSGADIREHGVSVVMDDGEGFALMLGDLAIATSRSARALSRWAFDRGALAVRHDYDLRLDP